MTNNNNFDKSAARFRIGVDVGGTFTDFVAIDDGGRITVAKSASTPRDQSIGVLAGLSLLADSLGIERPRCSARRIVSSTGPLSRPMRWLERKGAKLGLLTTEGHRDILEMREGLKDDRYALRQPAAGPPGPASSARAGARAHPGRRQRGDAASACIAALGDSHPAAERVEAVAVCYLHAYRSPGHEHITAEALARALPGVYVSLSSQVFPQIKEFERVCTTVVNAYVGPVLERYLDASPSVWPRRAMRDRC